MRNHSSHIDFFFKNICYYCLFRSLAKTNFHHWPFPDSFLILQEQLFSKRRFWIFNGIQWKNLQKYLLKNIYQHNTPVFFIYLYNLHFFEQKIYSHQVLIYLNVPGIPFRKPLQNRLIDSWRTIGCMSFRGDLCKLVDWGTFINEQKG